MASMSINGVVSGMDWESMIDEIITAAAKPAQVQVSKRTNLQNKKSLFEEMKVMVQSIQTSLTSLKLPSTYKAKAVDIERTDSSGSYKGVLTATVNADAEVNVHDVEVKQLATAQTNRSTQITAGTIASTLSSAGITSTSSKMYITAAGQRIGIDVYSTDSLQSLKSRINTTVKTLASPLEVTASVVDNKLVIRSDNTGLGTKTVEGIVRGGYSSNGHTSLTGLLANAEGTSTFDIAVSEDNTDNLKIMSEGTTYTYGTDYVVVNGTEVRWKQNDRSSEVALGDYVNARYTMAAGDVYTASGQMADEDGKNGDAAQIFGFTMTDNGTLASRVKIVDEDRTTYTYGTDFTITNSKVVWLEKDTSSTTSEPSSYTVSYSKDVAVTSTTDVARTGSNDAIDLKDLTTAYKEAYSLDDDDDLPTITLTDGKGVLRTYLDPADRSLFTMKGDDDTEYTYGKDYVIRVNDAGNGWVVSWAITGDTNSDGSTDINDASEIVTAYMQEKGITTLDMKEAPETSSTLTFSRDVTITDSGTVKSSDTDKSLATILEDVGSTVSISDYSTAITIKSGSTTYTYGKDYTIDDDGNIEWLTKATLTEKPSSYKVTYSDAEYDYPADASDITTLFTTLLADEDADLEDVIITLSNGSVCTYGTDYTINDDGTIDWIIHTQPDAGKSYTLYYESFSALKATADCTEGDSTTALSSFSGVDLTYSEILSDAGVSKQKTSETDDEYQERIDTALAAIFTLSDSVDTYEYGTDYRITADSDDAPQITWLQEPTRSEEMTLVYTGRGEGGGEVLSMPDAIQRSASDTINLSSALDMPLYSKFEGAAVRITNGSETFEEGTDFTVSEGSGGYAVITWNTDTTIPPLYTGQFDSTTSITAADSNGNAITGFTVSDEDGYAAFSMDDGSVLEAGDYTVTVVKGGRTKIYDLISDGSSMTLVQRSKWNAQDVSSAGKYTITVSKDGNVSTYTGTRPKNSYDFKISKASIDFTDGTNTITQGTKTFYEGVDFNITTDSDGNSTVDWIPDADGGYEWYYPVVSSSYTLTHTDSDGNSVSFTGVRTSQDTLSLQDYGMTIAKGELSVQYGEDTNYYNLNVEPVYETDEDGNYVLDADGNKIVSSSSVTGNDVLKATHSFTINERPVWTGTVGEDSTKNNYSMDYVFNWLTPELTSRSLPGYGDELSIEYEYDANTFSLEDDGDGLIDALGLNVEDNITEAHNAIISLNGEEVQRDSNNIGEAYGNEISNLKGVTLQLKGLGTVSLDIYHDAEKAIEAITTFKDSYNDLMTWMNTRMTESQVDEDTAATIDSDDFRMRWGLLHGNSLLRQTKSTMRNLTAQTFTYSFTQNTSSSEIYGTMANNGLRNDSTLRMRIGSTYMDLTVSPSHTLQDVVDMINDSTNVQMYNNFYDENGKLREQPLIKASVSDDKLTLSSTSSDTITLSGTSAMKALKMNYTYTGLFQLGLATTSTDYGKSGELEFDESKFMEALEDNSDETQELMLMFANSMDSWVKSMLTSSASGETKGTLSRQIDDLDTQIASIDEYLEKYQERLDRQEEALRTKFAAAEQNIAELSQQAASISSILSMLNNNSSSSSSSSSSAS